MTALPSRAWQCRVVACHGCGMVCEDVLDACAHACCPRCGAPLQRRKTNSIQRAWALLLAGMIFYIPANVLPVMYTSMLGRGADSTIMSGVIEFWKLGSYGVALIIFIASVAVPCVKFVSLGFLLFLAQRQSTWAMPQRARLYRMVEFIGYWSMLDVVVVAVVSALVKFGILTDTQPRAGIFYFGIVVVLTMLAAMSFDPRLTWDAEKTNERTR